MHDYRLRLVQKTYIRKYDLPACFNKMFIISARGVY